MAVFRNNKSKPDSAPAIHSLLGKDVMLTGEIHTGSQSLRIEGTVEGHHPLHGRDLHRPGRPGERAPSTPSISW